MLTREIVIELIHKSLINSANQLNVAVDAYNRKHYGTSFMLSVFADEEIAKAEGLSMAIINKTVIEFKEIISLFRYHKEKHKELSLLTFARMPMIYAIDYVKNELDKLKIKDPDELSKKKLKLINKFTMAMINNPGSDFEGRIKARLYYYGSESKQANLQKWRERSQYIDIDDAGLPKGPFDITEVMAREYWLLVWENLYYTDFICNEERLIKRLDLKKPPIAIPDGLLDNENRENLNHEN